MATGSDILATIPLFSLLDDQERSALAERLGEATFPAGATIFQTGQPGDTLYLVRSGEVEIFFKNDTGGRILLETATAGHFFGELSLLDRRPRNATVTSKTDMELLVIGQRQFNGLLDTIPTLARKLISAMAARMRDQDAKSVH